MTRTFPSRPGRPVASLLSRPRPLSFRSRLREANHDCFLCRHFSRVLGYARASDYVHGVTAAAFGPGALLAMEKFSPSHVGKGGFAPVMRLAGAVGLAGGFLYFYQRSARTFLPNPRNPRNPGEYPYVLEALTCFRMGF